MDSLWHVGLSVFSSHVPCVPSGATAHLENASGLLKMRIHTPALLSPLGRCVGIRRKVLAERTGVPLLRRLGVRDRGRRRGSDSERGRGLGKRGPARRPSALLLRRRRAAARETGTRAGGRRINLLQY